MMARPAELTGTPASPVPRFSPLAEQFSQQFPAHDLPSVLAKFSLPVSLSEFRNPLAPPVQEVSHRSPGVRPSPQSPQCCCTLSLGLGGAASVGATCRAEVTKKLAPQPGHLQTLGQSHAPHPTLVEPTLAV